MFGETLYEIAVGISSRIGAEADAHAGIGHLFDVDLVGLEGAQHRGALGTLGLLGAFFREPRKLVRRECAAEERIVGEAGASLPKTNMPSSRARVEITLTFFCLSSARKSAGISWSRTLWAMMLTPSSITMRASPSSTMCAMVNLPCLRAWSNTAETNSRASFGRRPPWLSIHTLT